MDEEEPMNVCETCGVFTDSVGTIYGNIACADCIAVHTQQRQAVAAAIKEKEHKRNVERKADRRERKKQSPRGTLWQDKEQSQR